jgi:hypothetical protein
MAEALPRALMVARGPAGCWNTWRGSDTSPVNRMWLEWLCRRSFAVSHRPWYTHLDIHDISGGDRFAGTMAERAGPC